MKYVLLALAFVAPVPHSFTPLPSMLALTCALGSAQDPLPPPPIAGAAPLLDVDGNVPKPGEWPKSTSVEARAAFEKLLAASRVANADARPVTAFDLAIDLRYRASSIQENNFPDTRYRFLAPNALRMGTGNGREHVRGPAGDWLVDTSKPDKPEKISLAVGRENAEDRRQLDEAVNVARNFVGLTDPKSLRVLSLKTLAAAPANLPAPLRAAAAKLAWLEIESPDLYVNREGRAPSRSARLQLGLDPATSLPAQALVDDATAPRVLAPSTLCLALSNYKASDGFQVPYTILVYAVEVPEGSAPRFREKPAMDMVLKRANLRADLKLDDFKP